MAERENAAGDELDRCNNCDMRLDDCTCDWRKLKTENNTAAPGAAEKE